jgi:hypothetical protein
LTIRLLTLGYDTHSHVVPHPGPLATILNQPGNFVHWSIFYVSVANLVLIAVMVVISGAALLLPFPRGHREEPTAVAGEATDGDLAAVAPGAPDDEDARMWTARCGAVR